MEGTLGQRFAGLFRWRSRASRQDYWLALALSVACLVLLVPVALVASAAGFTSTVVLLSLVLVVPASLLLGLTAFRRLRDRNRSTIWALLFLIAPSELIRMAPHADAFRGAIAVRALLFLAGAAIAVWSFVELGFLRGTVGPNRYGKDPLGEPPVDAFD
jgi:uncharacterized membrane protein YhaH (DUF805 family)